MAASLAAHAAVFDANLNIQVHGGIGYTWEHDAHLYLLDVPVEAFMAATITLGRPRGGHGAVRRRPLGEVVFEESWGQPAPWATDPPGTRYTSTLG